MGELWQIGNVIRMLRIASKLSQTDLANGICTQAEISRIEHNLTDPHATTLHLIAQRLGVDMNFFFNEQDYSKLQYVDNTVYLMRKFVEEGKYEEVGQVIENEKHNPVFNKPLYKQLILWHEGLVMYYVKHDMQSALTLLYEALSIHQPSIHYSETQIEILISIGNLYGENNHFEKAHAYYDKAKISYEKLTITNSPRALLRLLYNSAVTLISEKRLIDALEQCKEGIQLCKETKSIYLLGEFYYQIAKVHCRLGVKEEAINCLHTAVMIFDYMDNNFYKEYAETKLQKLKSESM